MNEPVDIIINNFRRLNYLKILIDQIKIRTEYPYRIIVVDNASIPETMDFVKDLEKNGNIYKAISNDKNYPLPQSFKRGFQYVQSKYFVMTVDDTIPPWTKPCWLTHLVHYIESMEKYGAIALGYVHCNSDKYFENKDIKQIDVPLDLSNVGHRYSVEEFFQIQRTEEMKKIEFSKKNVGMYEFSRDMEKIWGKKIGRTTVESKLTAMAWDDDNLGYPLDVKGRKKFYEVKRFNKIRIVACFMAHHDDEFIDRFLANIGQFTKEFYINLNEPTPYTEKACRNHPYTKKIIETKNDKCWSQGLQRENTIRMLDDVRPDVVLFPDTDELFCDDLMEVLAKFWESVRNSCWFEMKYCWGDENTVRLDGAFKKMVHVRAFKWDEGITYWPYVGFACPRNFLHEKKGQRKFLSKSPVKHLKLLKKENEGRYEEEKDVKKRLQTYDKFDENFGA